MENVKNLLRFDLNDNLKKFIREVELPTKYKVNRPMSELVKHFASFQYSVRLLYPERPIDIIGECKPDIVKGCVDVMVHDDTTISIPKEHILSGDVIFTNTQRSDETELFKMVLGSELYETNYQYEFIKEAFINIPVTYYHRRIMIDSAMFTLYDFDDYSICLMDAFNQYHTVSPLKLLTSSLGKIILPKLQNAVCLELENVQRDTIQKIESMERTADGLLIPKISKITPLTEYEGE